MTSSSIIIAKGCKLSKGVEPGEDAGLQLKVTSADTVDVVSIAHDSIFHGTDLKVGMMLLTINNKVFSTEEEAYSLLKKAQDKVEIVASNTPKSIAVVFKKPSKDSKLGVGLGCPGGVNEGTVKITSIDKTGCIAGTKLEVGMKIEAINGMRFATTREASALLKEAKRTVTVVATRTHIPRDPPPGAPEGGIWGSNVYVGSRTWGNCVFCTCLCGVFGICALLHPVDERDAYRRKGVVSCYFSHYLKSL